MFSVIQQLHYSLQPTCNSPVNRFCNNLTVYYVTWKLLPSAKACTSSSSTSAQRQTSWNSIQSQVNSNYSHSLHPKTHPTNNGLLSRMVSRDFAISCLQLSYPRVGAISIYTIDCAFGWGTALQSGRQRVRFPRFHWNFSLTRSFSTMARNEYQEYFVGGKGGRCVGLTLPPLRVDSLELKLKSCTNTMIKVKVKFSL